MLLLSPTKLSDLDGTASRTPSHEESSESRDGTSVPLLLRTESIQLQDLDRTLLAEVKDVLIPHEQVVVHTDQVIGKGVEDRLGDGTGHGRSMHSWSSPHIDPLTNLCDLEATKLLSLHIVTFGKEVLENLLFGGFWCGKWASRTVNNPTIGLLPVFNVTLANLGL